MATATKRGAPARPQPKGTLDYLQHALDDLGHAREHAHHDARASIDSAIERIRDAVKHLGDRAHDETHEWQDRLEQVSAEARLELGRAAVRAQWSPEALTELADEIRHRKRVLNE